MIAFLTTDDSLRLVKPARCFFTVEMVHRYRTIGLLSRTDWYPMRQYRPPFVEADERGSLIQGCPGPVLRQQAHAVAIAMRAC